jgi:thiol:disulfide interchange protein DsbD
VKVTGSWEKSTSDDLRPILLHSDSREVVDFFPYTADSYEVQAGTERTSANDGKVTLRKLVKKLEGEWPNEVAGVIVAMQGDTVTGYEVKVRVGSVSTGGEGAALSKSSTTAGDKPPVREPEIALEKRSLLFVLISAFVGGLILNVMPCVLPVIALKILGFVNQSREAPAHVRRLGLIYAVGILTSFLVLAGIVVAVKAAGHRASWGMQFGNPVFIVSLTVLVTLVALNLFGIFEVTLSGKLMGAAGELAGKEGAAGAFFNGVLATALATPCTAPFLGAALGFAFAETASVIVLTFLTVGAGLAAPYVLLTWNPAWLKFLPKPGAWMEKFKIAMGFPMLATMVWLFTLTQVHYGKRVLWLGFFLVALAVAAWVFGEFVQRGRKRKGLAVALAAGILAGSYAYAMEGQLHWRAPLKPIAAAAGSLAERPDGIQWRAWSRQAVDQARAAGRPVFVDFTADWCVTCQANKKTSIEIPSVREKLKEIDAVALLGDYTAVPDNITDELNRFGRAGVPLVLVYSRDSARPPIVLPELLTPRIVLDALTRAAQ